MYILLVSLLIHGSAVFAEDSAISQSSQATAPPNSESTAPVASPTSGEPAKAQTAGVSPTKKTINGRVSKIYPDSKKVVVILDPSIQLEDIPKTWEFTNAKSESCEGSSLQSQSNTLLIDFSGCTNFSQITAGTTVSPSLFQPPSPPINEIKAASPIDQAPSSPTPDKRIEESNPESDTTYQRSIVDLQLFPEQTKAIFNIDYGSGNSDITTSLADSNGRVTENKIKSSQLTLSAMYGLLDNLAIGAAFKQVLDSSNEVTFGPASLSYGTKYKTKSKGWSDPTFLLTYRAAEQNLAPVTVDLMIGYSPKSGDSIEATTTKDGNSKRGGDSTDLGIEIGKKYTNSSFTAGMMALFNGRTTSREVDSTEKTTGDAYTHSVFMVRGQIKASEFTHVRGRIQVDYYSDQKLSTPGYSDVIAKAYTQSTLGADILLSPSANLCVNFGVQKHMSADEDGYIDNTHLKGTSDGSEVHLGATMAF